MKPREGDLIESVENVIFDVKGLVHPHDKVVAFPRFIPHIDGSRRRKNVAYKKVYGISERFKFLEQNLPNYITYDAVFDERLCTVPLENVKYYYDPTERLMEMRKSSSLDELEMDALEFMEILKSSANVPWNKMGVSGSLLAKLHTPTSDIDPLIYGSRNCRKIYEALQSLVKDCTSSAKVYSEKELKKLFAFRVKDTRTSFEEFLQTESRKIMQGKFKGRDYFIRFVKDWNEVKEHYGEVRYRNVGYAKIEAEIEDDSESIFTPCRYKIRKLRVIEGNSFPYEEIVSFRGRFCEQARKGERVIAQGKAEKVMDFRQKREFFRLLLGNKPSDFMVLAGA